MKPCFDRTVLIVLLPLMLAMYSTVSANVGMDATGMLDIWSLIENPPDGMVATDVYIYGMELNEA